MVCSPADTTIQGARTLEKHGFRSGVMEAAIATCETDQLCDKSGVNEIIDIWNEILYNMGIMNHMKGNRTDARNQRRENNGNLLCQHHRRRSHPADPHHVRSGFYSRMQSQNHARCPHGQRLYHRHHYDSKRQSGSQCGGRGHWLWHVHGLYGKIRYRSAKV